MNPPIKFYRREVQAVGWAPYREEPAKYLPSISRWENLWEMLSELSGELNASHMSSTNERGVPQNFKNNFPMGKLSNIDFYGFCEFRL